MTTTDSRPSEAAPLDISAYEAADRMQWIHRPELVIGGRAKPRWIDGGARFWYMADTAEGRQPVLVDPGAGTREPGFDPSTLPGAAAANFLESVSPDGRLAVFRKGHDLWARSVADGREWALTTDGEADREYATNPDTMVPSALLRRVGIPALPPNLAWSPDSRRILTHLTDQRGMREASLVEALPPGGGAPRLHSKRYALPNDERMPLCELVVIDVEAATVVRARTEPLLMPLASPVAMGMAWWTEGPDGEPTVCYLSQPRDYRTLSLHRLNPATGEVTAVLEEHGETRVDANQYMGGRPIVRVFGRGRELLWYSQRDGWGHLYLYDAASGELRRQVTSGEWAVQRILRVDEDERVVWFVAAGLVAGDPYRRSVCRIGLDGSGFARVTDDDLDHLVEVPENEAYFVDSASTVATPPVIAVRGWDGSVIVPLERADASRLQAAGWTPPERIRVTAADGETDVYGVILLPRGFDPSRAYPVLDSVYPGPNTNRVSQTFDPGFVGGWAEMAAALGFVVVAIDGRGTPGRSKAFMDASYGHLEDGGGLQDHVAGIRQLAETRPWMDLDRVGIFGHSGGGWATARAMLLFPDFYKVGVAVAGSHDLRYYNLCVAEMYDGPGDDALYARASNVEIADRLQGRLFLIHGGVDDNVFPDQTLQLVERLIEADKDFDLLIVPGSEHLLLGYDGYVLRRLLDFLVRHLLGVEPPEGRRITTTQLSAELLAELFA